MARKKPNLERVLIGNGLPARYKLEVGKIGPGEPSVRKIWDEITDDGTLIFSRGSSVFWSGPAFGKSPKEHTHPDHFYMSGHTSNIVLRGYLKALYYIDGVTSANDFIERLHRKNWDILVLATELNDKALPQNIIDLLGRDNIGDEDREYLFEDVGRVLKQEFARLSSGCCDSLAPRRIKSINSILEQHNEGGLDVLVQTILSYDQHIRQHHTQELTNPLHMDVPYTRLPLAEIVMSHILANYPETPLISLPYEEEGVMGFPATPKVFQEAFKGNEVNALRIPFTVCNFQDILQVEITGSKERQEELFPGYPKRADEGSYVIALHGPTGSGKTALAHHISEFTPKKYAFASMVTTRARRYDDSGRVIEEPEYTFIDDSTYQTLQKTGLIIDNTYGGNKYGITIRELTEELLREKLTKEDFSKLSQEVKEGLMGKKGIEDIVERGKHAIVVMPGEDIYQKLNERYRGRIVNITAFSYPVISEWRITNREAGNVEEKDQRVRVQLPKDFSFAEETEAELIFNPSALPEGKGYIGIDPADHLRGYVRLAELVGCSTASEMYREAIGALARAITGVKGGIEELQTIANSKDTIKLNFPADMLNLYAEGLGLTDVVRKYAGSGGRKLLEEDVSKKIEGVYKIHGVYIVILENSSDKERKDMQAVGDLIQLCTPMHPIIGGYKNRIAMPDQDNGLFDRLALAKTEPETFQAISLYAPYQRGPSPDPNTPGLLIGFKLWKEISEDSIKPASPGDIEQWVATSYKEMDRLMFRRALYQLQQRPL